MAEKAADEQLKMDASSLDTTVMSSAESAEELKALSFVRKSLLRKNEQIRQLKLKIGHMQEKIDELQWKCDDQEKEIDRLVTGSFDERSGIGTEGEEFLDETTNDRISNEFMDQSTESTDIADNALVSRVVGDLGTQRQSAVKSDQVSPKAAEHKNNTSQSTLQREIPRLKQEFTNNSPELDENCLDPHAREAMNFSSAPSPLKKRGAAHMDESDAAAAGPSSAVGPHKRRSKREFPCPQCGKPFQKPSDLSRHFLVHTGDKPFTCAHCPYRARRKEHLKRHVVMRHLQCAERPFTCAHCAYTTDRADLLHRHVMRNHAAAVTDHYDDHVLGQLSLLGQVASGVGEEEEEDDDEDDDDDDDYDDEDLREDAGFKGVLDSSSPGDTA